MAICSSNVGHGNWIGRTIRRSIHTWEWDMGRDCHRGHRSKRHRRRVRRRPRGRRHRLRGHPGHRTNLEPRKQIPTGAILRILCSALIERASRHTACTPARMCATKDGRPLNAGRSPRRSPPACQPSKDDPCHSRSSGRRGRPTSTANATATWSERVGLSGHLRRHLPDGAEKSYPAGAEGRRRVQTWYLRETLGERETSTRAVSWRSSWVPARPDRTLLFLDLFPSNSIRLNRAGTCGLVRQAATRPYTPTWSSHPSAGRSRSARIESRAF